MDESYGKGLLSSADYIGISFRETRFKGKNSMGESGYYDSSLFLLYLGIEHFLVGTSERGRVAFAEVGGTRGRIYEWDGPGAIESGDQVRSGFATAIGYRGWYSRIFGELRLTYDTPTSNLIPSFVSGIRF